ncbi:MAG: hypothetical protein WKG07_46765 [Hymenobacter sp.]
MTNPPIIGPAALPALAELLRQAPPSRLFVLADANTARDCYPRLRPTCRPTSC